MADCKFQVLTNMPGHFRIHPTLGVARMGNSPEHYTGPENPGVPANSDDGVTFRSFRDSQGKILRQAARFRVFEYDTDSNGRLSNPREIQIAGEITNIEWRVHLANRKASFYSFYGQLGASDLYLERSQRGASDPIKRPDDSPQRTNLRNPEITTDRTQRLDIDPGEKLISKNQPSPVELLNINPAIPIKSLGTLEVDDSGRLLVMGGYGESNSAENPPRTIDEYANNDSWFDDAADGSVKARIIFKDGSVRDADASWVSVGPPDFAPSVGHVVSLFDTLWDTAVREIDPSPSLPLTPLIQSLLDQKAAWNSNANNSLDGYKPSFTRDIFPLLKRAVGAIYLHRSGDTGNPHYHETLLGDWGLLSALTGANADEGSRMRRGIFNWIRDPNATDAVWEKMPRGLGDEYTQLDAGTPSPRSFLSLTRIQYALLAQWAKNNFIDDWSGAEPVFTPSPAPTPDDLDQAAVEGCVGGPFYPGIEISWLIRIKDLFSEPFRFKISKAPEDPGTPSTPLSVGALTFRPGFFSQQMALPWQADFYDCHKERWEDPDDNEYYFMWWTAQRPDDVFASKGTAPVRWVRSFDDPNKSPDENENDLQRFVLMQRGWFNLKFISVQNGNHYEEEP